jgi:MFS transporter, FSR family, fosmidomycin resistance protein
VDGRADVVMISAGMTPPARHRMVVRGGMAAALLALAHTVNDTLATLLAILLPGLQARFGLTETTLAVLVATAWASSSFTQPFFGVIADRVDRRLIVAVGVATSAVALSLLGVAPAVWGLFGLLVIGGLGSAALHPVGTTIARAENAGSRELAIGLFSAGGQIGYALGPLVILSLLASFGPRATPWLMVPGVGLAVLLYVLLPAGEPRVAEVGPRACLRCLASGPVAWLVAAGVLANLAFVTFTSAAPLWLVRERQVAGDSAMIGWTLTAFALGAVIGSLAGSVLATRYTRRVLVAGSLLLAVVPMLAMLWLPVGSVAFFAAVTLAGVLVCASFPLMILSAQDLVPDAMAAASSLLMGLAVGVAGALYVGVGWLQEAIGLTSALALSFLMLIPSAVLSWSVLSRHLPEHGRELVGTPEPADEPATVLAPQ